MCIHQQRSLITLVSLACAGKFPSAIGSKDFSRELTTELPLVACEPWCGTHSAPWEDRKCNWRYSCGGCEECTYISNSNLPLPIVDGSACIEDRPGNFVDFTDEAINNVMTISNSFDFSEDSATINSPSNPAFTGKAIYGGFWESGDKKANFVSGRNDPTKINSSVLKIRWNPNSGTEGDIASALYLFKSDADCKIFIREADLVSGRTGWFSNGGVVSSSTIRFVLKDSSGYHVSEEKNLRSMKSFSLFPRSLCYFSFDPMNNHNGVGDIGGDSNPTFSDVTMFGFRIDAVRGNSQSFVDIGLVSFSVQVGEELSGENSSSVPSALPSMNPSRVPSNHPSTTFTPSEQFGGTPRSFTLNPTAEPTFSSRPSRIPTLNPSATIRPTFYATLLPSHEPSSSVTPTESPSEHPSASMRPSLTPTSKPSYEPTLSVTPTKSRSEYPSTSIRPSLDPTLRPSYEPTLSIKPTKSPSQHPSASMRPSLTPTLKPTHEPTSTVTPTKSPSEHPSASIRPSLDPTLKPTHEPTLSFRPSRVHSTIPSASIRPTLRTNSPSRNPTIKPTHKASNKPFVNHTEISTMLPTFASSHSPSSSPPTKTLTPTLSSSPFPPFGDLSRGNKPTGSSLPLQNHNIKDIIMTLDECRPLDEDSIKVWVDVTKTHIMNEFVKQDYEVLPTINVDVLYQNAQESRMNNPGSSRRFLKSRRLQRTKLEITFSLRVRLLYDILIDTEAVATKILDMFNDTGQNDYISLLIDSGDSSFDNLSVVLVETERNVITRSEFIPPTSPSKTGGILIGIAVGATSFVLIFGFLSYKRFSGRSGEVMENKLGTGLGSTPTTSFMVQGVQQETSFAEPSPDDISTLGDPAFSFQNAGEKDGAGAGSVATVDYDYSKAFLGEDKSVSTAGGTLGDGTIPIAMSVSQRSFSMSTSQRSFSDQGTFMGNHTVFSEDASFEAQFRSQRMQIQEALYEIIAPPGRLGVVIDTPDEGAPRFHAIRDSSCLIDRINVGDKLIAVDDEDVRAMTAIRVSKMISQKSGNHRKLTILREIQ